MAHKAPNMIWNPSKSHIGKVTPKMQRIHDDCPVGCSDKAIGVHARSKVIEAFRPEVDRSKLSPKSRRRLEMNYYGGS